MKIRIVQGDIAAQDVDAVVSAASTALRMGSGVAGSLLEAAGEELAAVTGELAPIPLGEAVVTDAFALDADVVVHAAATPDWGHRRATRESVRRATANSLAAADQHGCRSVAVPPLGCGNGGLHVQDGAAAIVEAIADVDPDNVVEGRLVAPGDFECEMFERALASREIGSVDRRE